MDHTYTFRASSMHGPHLHCLRKLFAQTAPALSVQAPYIDHTYTVRLSSIHGPHLHCLRKLYAQTTPALSVPAPCTDPTFTATSPFGTC